MQYPLHKANHSVYAIHLHVYLVTKYRRKFLSEPIAKRVHELCQGICQGKKCEILESGCELDHIHFLIDLHPDNNISILIKSMKSVTAQMILKEFPTEFRKTYKGGTSLWGRQKGIISCGGAPLETVKKYIAGHSDSLSSPSV
ncbi:MAG: IS200/IS605 family transposase [Alphaproteobacteria bacterium]